MIENPLPTHKEFRREGVTVTIPGRVRPIQVERLALPTLESMPVVRGGFQPFRVVINLRLVDAAQPDRELSMFDPPIEIRVRYTTSDLENAAAVGRPLCLGFWDGKQWIRFTPEKHQFHLKPAALPEDGGWGIVNISHWGDPTHAWGT